MGACASSQASTVPDPSRKSAVTCSTPRKEQAAGPSCTIQAQGGQIQPCNSALLTDNKLPLKSQHVDEGHCSNPDGNFRFLHDSAGSLPGLTEQSGLAPAERAALCQISAWGSMSAPNQQPLLLPTTAQRTSFEMVTEERRIGITFNQEVATSPFEAGLSEHRQRQLRHSLETAQPPKHRNSCSFEPHRDRERQQRHSEDLPRVNRQGGEAMDVTRHFWRERNNCRQFNMAEAPRQLRNGADVVSELERTNRAGLERILRLSASVFRTDSVLLHLRDGDKVIAGGEDAAFSEGVRAAACRAFAGCTPGIAVISNPASDPRLAGEDDARAALKFVAGVPFVASNGYRIGSMVLCHGKPYTLEPANRAILKNMADLMLREVWGAYEHAHEQRILQLTKVADCYSEPLLFVEVSHLQPWRILHINQAAVRVTGLERDNAMGELFWDVFDGAQNSSNTKRAEVAYMASRGASFCLTNMMAFKCTAPKTLVPITLTCTFRPAAREVQGNGEAKPRAISNASRYYYFVGISAEATPTSCVERTPFKGLVFGSQLGKGAYGRVYKGFYNGSVIAVKVCASSDLRYDAAGVSMEASLIGQLEHPNLVRVLDMGNAGTPAAKAPKPSSTFNQKTSTKGGEAGHHGALIEGTPLDSALDSEETWLLLEYCDMGSLMDAVGKVGFLSPPKGPANLPIVVATALGMASGLAFLHSQGLMHGDLSSGNVLLASSPDAPHGFRAKISDFGLSRKMDIQSRIETKTTGTINYMPPEVLSDGIVSKAADVYAFGVLLWEMACGKRAWGGLSTPQVMLAVAYQQNQLTYPTWAPPELVKLGQECMAADLKARPKMEEVERRLQKLQEKLLVGSDAVDISQCRARSCPVSLAIA
ncbi:g5238 [Coccomyxa elongata]